MKRAKETQNKVILSSGAGLLMNPKEDKKATPLPPNENKHLMQEPMTKRKKVKFSDETTRISYIPEEDHLTKIRFYLASYITSGTLEKEFQVLKFLVVILKDNKYFET